MIPRVSVLMAVYNAAPYVEESLASVLGQSLCDLEVVVVDDGSTDGSAAIVERLARSDPRVRLARQENRGLPAALNAGLTHARAPFVARMDADDISLPERLARQADFLDAHLDVAVVGGAVRTFGRARGNVWRYPVNPADVAAALLFVNPIAHPAAMFRRAAVEALGGYDEGNRYGEDYALWAVLSAEHRLANLAEVVLRYRVHGDQMGAVRTDEVRREWYMRTQAMLLRRLGVEVDGEDLTLHHLISTAHLPTTEMPARESLLDEAEAWLLRLQECNGSKRILDPGAFARRLGWHWRAVCGALAGEGLSVWRRWRSSVLVTENVGGADDMLLFAACGLRFGNRQRRRMYRMQHVLLDMMKDKT